MTASIVEFPKTKSDVLKQLLAPLRLEASEEWTPASRSSEIICTLLRDNQKQAHMLTALSKALTSVR